MACSEKQLIANRENALKSTGPVTQDGKARSRRNAVKHGLCAQVVSIAGEDQSQLETERESWVTELAPKGVVATRLAEQAFLAYVRLNRCQRAENAATVLRRAEARRNFRIKRYETIKDALASIEEDSTAAVPILRASPLGCKALKREFWKMVKLLSSFEWNAATSHRLEALCLTEFEEDNTVRVESSHMVAFAANRNTLKSEDVSPTATEEELGRYYRPETVAAFLKDRQTGMAAREKLIKHCRDRMAELDQRAAELQASEENRIQCSIEVAIIDDSAEALRRHRYACDAERSMHRNIHGALAAARNERALTDDGPEQTATHQADQAASHQEAAVPTLLLAHADSPARRQNEANSEPALQQECADATDEKAADASVSGDVIALSPVPDDSGQS